jgi:hypothetical protein
MILKCGVLWLLTCEEQKHQHHVFFFDILLCVGLSYTCAWNNSAIILKLLKTDLTSKLLFCSHAEVDTSLDKGAKMDTAKILPPHDFLYEDASHCNPADNNFSCSAVMPSLPLTIKWLRDCVKENPSVRVQVRLLSEMATCSFFNVMLKWLRLHIWFQRNRLGKLVLKIHLILVWTQEMVKKILLNDSASFDNVFWKNFLLCNKKAKALTNNFKHKTLKTTFTVMSHHNTFSPKKTTGTI